jgi:C-terminal processing protease CtpA/Prc
MTSTMGAREARSSRRSKPVRRRSSSSHKGGFCSVTVRKSHPNERVGIEMVVEDGRYKVAKIANNSIFVGSELQAGDTVLSFNGKSVRDSFIDEMIESGNNAEDKVTIVINQASAGPRKERKTEGSKPNEVMAEREGNEDVGIRFKVQGNKLIVSEIHEDSIFHATELRVGDCVAKINEMDFFAYADAAYALRIANKKGSKTVTLHLRLSQ